MSKKYIHNKTFTNNMQDSTSEEKGTSLKYSQTKGEVLKVTEKKNKNRRLQSGCVAYKSLSEYKIKKW